MWWGGSQKTNTWKKCGPPARYAPAVSQQGPPGSQQGPPRSQQGSPRSQQGSPRSRQVPPWPQRCLLQRPPAGRQPGSSTVRHPSSPGFSPGHDLRPGPLPRPRTGPGHPELWQPSAFLRRPQGWPGPPQGPQGCLVMTQARHCTAPMWRPQGRPKIYHHFTICPGSGSQTRLLARQGQPPPLTLPFTSSTVARQLGPGRPGPTNRVGQARRKARHRAPARLNTPRLTRPLALEIARLPSWPPAGLPA